MPMIPASWFLRRAAGLLVLAFLFVDGAQAAAPQATEGRYLFDILKDPVYRRAWSRMIGSPGPRERWLRADRLSGPGGPSREVWIAGRSYERADTCKRHDCGDNRFEVLFAPGGTRAVGVLRQPGRARIFGSPSAAERRALLGV
ncbi:hypothetical protein DK26_19710 [Bosea sp. WAO]|uniref:Ivy family c-type lysozyme inhibitor n=1 Tax=Bosea sp. WAO TaxID=406341 RepID=UPI00074AD273|nr:Ivy family c-type lysozyme inhibitor [Bosea sp. WAO]KUL93962.1 hypothetical protein DK26_19710 [Bosea sp. WAO]